MVVTDITVWALFGARVSAALACVCPAEALVVLQVPPGEGSKSRRVKETLEDALIAAGCVQCVAGPWAAIVPVLQSLYRERDRLWYPPPLHVVRG